MKLKSLNLEITRYKMKNVHQFENIGHCYFCVLRPSINAYLCETDGSVINHKEYRGNQSEKQK